MIFPLILKIMDLTSFSLKSLIKLENEIYYHYSLLKNK